MATKHVPKTFPKIVNNPIRIHFNVVFKRRKVHYSWRTRKQMLFASIFLLIISIFICFLKSKSRMCVYIFNTHHNGNNENLYKSWHKHPCFKKELRAENTTQYWLVYTRTHAHTNIHSKSSNNHHRRICVGNLCPLPPEGTHQKTTQSPMPSNLVY